LPVVASSGPRRLILVVMAVTDQKIIDYMRDMIRGSFAEEVEVDLGMLLLTVDARQHCVPTPTEVNRALRQVERYGIVRDEHGVRIVSADTVGTQIVRRSDIVHALDLSRSIFGQPEP